MIKLNWKHYVTSTIILVVIVFVAVLLTQPQKELTKSEMENEYPAIRNEAYKLVPLTTEIFEYSRLEYEISNVTKGKLNFNMQKGYYCEKGKFKEYTYETFVSKDKENSMNWAITKILECGKNYWIINQTKIGTGPIYGQFTKDLQM